MHLAASCNALSSVRERAPDARNIWDYLDNILCLATVFGTQNISPQDSSEHLNHILSGARQTLEELQQSRLLQYSRSRALAVILHVQLD